VACNFDSFTFHQVRLSQLDKEGAELRDENAQLHSRLSGLQEAAAADWQAQASASSLKRHKLICTLLCNVHMSTAL